MNFFLIQGTLVTTDYMGHVRVGNTQPLLRLVSEELPR